MLVKNKNINGWMEEKQKELEFITNRIETLKEENEILDTGDKDNLRNLGN